MCQGAGNPENEEHPLAHDGLEAWVGVAGLWLGTMDLHSGLALFAVKLGWDLGKAKCVALLWAG